MMGMPAGIAGTAVGHTARAVLHQYQQSTARATTQIVDNAQTLHGVRGNERPHTYTNCMIIIIRGPTVQQEWVHMRRALVAQCA